MDILILERKWNYSIFQSILSNLNDYFKLFSNNLRIKIKNGIKVF